MPNMPQEYESRVHTHLDVNNGLDRVRELVHTRLVESGWRDQVKLAIRTALAENSRNQVPTVDELITTVTPKARAMVPDAVKRELLHEIELILTNMEKTGYNKTFED
ncbi:enhancer of yellow 2 transcription factor-like [Anthonomus grandis grandis]|uniref:enhancer of yellow 2 transcription factor-like n=1 Tax=Anthonomus grandis grandis TaxID=2921223 RepID=UPI002166250F|nr:enhancer of yellow 2 transcription factor-like [Anthonomus grandis grandis]